MKNKYRDPKKEKELDYENYHFSPGKSDKGFRKAWKRKKARGHRFERHKVKQLLQESDIDYDKSVTTELKSHDVKPEKPIKWDVMTLRERIAYKKAKRERMHRARINRRKVG